MAEISALLDRDLFAVAKEVARQLAHAFERQDGVYICTPLLYASGAAVVVHISRGRAGEFIVSEMAGGYHEARLTGADQHYTRAANSVAEKAGVRSDGRTISDSGIPQEQLPVAVTVIANCSLEAWNLAEHRNRDRKRRDITDEFFARVFRAVKGRQPLADVARDIEIRGNSTSDWQFDIAVKVRESRSLFDVVTPHPQSVAFATTKCSDVSRLPYPPTLVCVVENRKAFGSRLGWLLPVATVIESAGASEKLLIELAHAN